MQAVAIVVSSQKTYDLMQHWYRFQEVELRVPALAGLPDETGHQMDYTDDPAVFAAFQHPQCVDRALAICRGLTQGSPIGAPAAEAVHISHGNGFGMAAVIGKMVEEMMNSVYDVDGHRKFVCRVVPLYRDLDLAACYATFNSAIAWVRSHPAAGPGADPRVTGREDRWASWVLQTHSESARATFGKMWTWVDCQNRRYLDTVPWSEKPAAKRAPTSPSSSSMSQPIEPQPQSIEPQPQPIEPQQKPVAQLPPQPVAQQPQPVAKLPPVPATPSIEPTMQNATQSIGQPIDPPIDQPIAQQQPQLKPVLKPPPAHPPQPALAALSQHAPIDNRNKAPPSKSPPRHLRQSTAQAATIDAQTPQAAVAAQAPHATVDPPPVAPLPVDGPAFTAVRLQAPAGQPPSVQTTINMLPDPVIPDTAAGSWKMWHNSATPQLPGTVRPSGPDSDPDVGRFGYRPFSAGWNFKGKDWSVKGGGWPWGKGGNQDWGNHDWYAGKGGYGKGPYDDWGTGGDRGKGNDWGWKGGDVSGKGGDFGGKGGDGRRRSIRLVDTWKDLVSEAPVGERIWVSELDRMGVDESAQMELFCLSQQGASGRSLASALIALLIRDEGQIDNISAYVHRTVTTAWESMDWGLHPSRGTLGF